MTLDYLFSGAGTLVLPAWIALVALPHRVAAARWIAVTVAVAIAMLYAALLGAYWTQAGGGFDSLANVARLFDSRGMLLAGWVHYLAFDLLVGLWEREEAARLGLSRSALIPSLVLTFLFGPLGWLLFMALRWFHLQRTALPVAA
jgi:hypothetical protein